MVNEGDTMRRSFRKHQREAEAGSWERQDASENIVNRWRDEEISITVERRWDECN